MDVEPIAIVFELTLSSILLGMVRTFAFASFFFAFTWAHCNRGIVRFGLAIALGLPVAMRLTVAELPLPTPDTLFLYAALIAKEIAIGFALAVVLSIPFWAVEISGAGLSILRFESADANEEIGQTPLQRMMILLMIGAFAFTDAPERILRILYLTYDLWPVTSYVPRPSNIGWPDLEVLVRDALVFAIVIVVPFLAATLIFEALLTFKGRFSRYVNLQESLLLRSLIIIVGLTLTIVLMMTVFMDYLAGFYGRILVVLMP